MALNLMCEPGDPRLRAALADLSPAELVKAIRSGRRLRGRPCPEAWLHAASDVDEQLGRVEALADAAGLRWLTPADRAWPERLSDLDHLDPEQGAAGAPLGLWLRGERRLSELVRSSVAIVGARDCTGYGAQVAAEIAADVSSAGITVISGAAYGIDASAHRGALSTLNPTLAVLACDAATDYPRAHGPMLNRIAAEGLVVSEQPPGQVPTKSRFLSRNRLIAALTGGTVVVEARRRSGSLNTLGWADRLGRVTMAVPGPVTSPQSVGPHIAIREGRAVLVSSGVEVIEELAALGAPPPPNADRAGRDAGTEWDKLSPDAARVLDAVEWSRGLGLDEIARRACLGRAAAHRALLSLTQAGWVTESGPAAWVLSRRADLAPTVSPRTVGE
jgi:DNA processing protein